MIRLTADQVHVLLPYVYANADDTGWSSEDKDQLKALLLTGVDLDSTIRANGDGPPPQFLKAVVELTQLGLLEGMIEDGEDKWRATVDGEQIVHEFVSHWQATSGTVPNGALRLLALRRVLSDG